MATYISGLCLPTVMLSTGVPYNVTTLEQLTADIATLNAILENACVTPPVPQLGFELTWDNIVNSPFATHTDLNTFINANGGAANYTSVVTVGNVQTFIGGTAVSLGSNFMNANPSIISIIDETSHVVGQLSGGQNKCAILALIDLPALASQVSYCQSGNILLATLKLPSLTTQGSNNQSNNAALTKLILQALETQVDSNQISNNAMTTLNMGVLTTQGNNNQNANPALTLISTPLLTILGFGNYTGCTFPILTINVDASLFGAADILAAQAGGATII